MIEANKHPPYAIILNLHAVMLRLIHVHVHIHFHYIYFMWAAIMLCEAFKSMGSFQ